MSDWTCGAGRRVSLMASLLLFLLAGGQPPAAPRDEPGAGPRAGTQAATQPAEGADMKLTVKSTAFAEGQVIPKKYTGEGQDVSPPLSWSGLPAETKELALICDDPDAPRAEPWVHWVIYKIPAAAAGLPENVARTEKVREPAGALQGKNSWGKIGYGGPMPPPGHGVHHYHFKLYALDAALEVPGGLTKDELVKRMKGHVLAEGELIGTYRR